MSLSLTLEIFRSVQADDPFAFRTGPQEYVFRSPLGGAETATLDWDEPLLQDLAALRLPSCAPAVLQRVGERLRRFVAATRFAGDEAELLVAVARGQTATITLRMSAAELYALPWELLAIKATGQYLGALPGVLLRYAWPETRTTPEEPSPRPEGGRILMVWSAAGGAVPAAEHQQAIAHACGLGNHPFDPALDVLPQVSYQRLADALDQARQRNPIAALHILCHGAGQHGNFGLLWNGDGDGGDRQLIDAAQLRQLLGGHASRLRLVVISACDSANSGQLGNRLGSLAQAVHRAGIAVVVASRYPLSVAGSIRLTQALYAALLSEPASVESAFRAARQRLAQAAEVLDWAGLQLYARPEDGDDSRPLVLRPYRGLEPFLLPHRRFFFGREKERQQARAALHALAKAGQPRFLVVAGASGTGKSSVVLGGLVPDLTAAAVTPNQPGEASAARRALGHLRGALGSYADRPPLSATLAALDTQVEALTASPDSPWEWAMMRPGPEPLATLATVLAGRRDAGRPLLLVVDQFEELFTHCADNPRRCAFAARLWALSREPTGIYCVVTLRVDFFGRCGELVLDPSGLRLDRIAYSEPHRVFVAQLEPAQLALAISGPAHLVGLQLKPDLVQRMLAEVAGEPGALPLLSYVLDLLWQRRQGALLSAASYTELGGVGGALGNNADRALHGLDAADQRLAQKLLVRLVGFSDSGGAETRQRVPLATLQEQIADPRLAGVLAAFVNARLLVRSEDRGQTVIEVAHEALIRKWQRLRSWLGEDRQRLAEVRELVQWAAQYSTYGTLLRGSQLGYAQRVRQKYPDELGRVIPQLIDASVLAQSRRRWSLTAAIAGVLCALSALSLYARQSQHLALRESRSATAKARLAQSRLLGMVAAREVATQPAVALLLATRAVTMHNEFQSRSVLAATLERTRPIRAFLPVPAGHIYGLAFSPDGQTLAVTGQQPGVWLYDGTTGARVGQRTAAANVEIYAIAWSPDGRQLAGGGSDGGIWLWDAADAQLAAVHVSTSGRSIYSLDFSGDGKILAAGSQDGQVLLLDVGTRRLLAPPLSGHTQLVASVSFRPGDSDSLATGSPDGTIRVFDVKARTLRIGPLTAHQGLSSNVAWSPDGQLLATGSEDHAVLLWQAGTGQLHGDPLLRHRAAVSATSFSPDGRLLASCGLDGAIVIWEVATGRPIGKELRGHKEAVQNCTWSRDGHSLASSSEGQVVLWDLADHPALHRQQIAVAVTALAIAPGRRYAAIGSPDGSVRLWQLAAARPEPPGYAEVGAVNAVAFSPDGQLLAAAGKDGGVALLQVNEGALVVARRLTAAQRSPALTLAFDPSGQTLAAGHADGTLRLWEVASGRLRTLPLGSRQQAITALAFSPEGSALVTGGFDGSITWRNPISGASLCDFRRAHQDEVTSLGFDLQGRYLASASRDKTLGLWRRAAVPPGCPVAAAEPLGRDAPAVAVTAVSFAADGRTLLAGDEAGAVTLWDVQARQAIGQPLYGHLQPITALVTSSDGGVLSGDEETLWRWDGNETAWPSRACARANRNLTGSEWQLYLDPSPYCRICPALPAGAAAPPGAPACDPS